MITKAILESHPVSVLKKEVRKSNIKKYSKLTKGEIIELMLKDENKGRFDHIKMAEKKERLPSTKKQVEFLEQLEEEDRKKAAKLPERKGSKKAVKVTTFGPTKPPRGKSKAFKEVIKELDEKGKVYRQARKEFGEDDPLRSKPKKESKLPKLTKKTREKEEEKLEKAYLKAMKKRGQVGFDQREVDRILNEGYKSLEKKYKKK